MHMKFKNINFVYLCIAIMLCLFFIYSIFIRLFKNHERYLLMVHPTCCFINKSNESKIYFKNNSSTLIQVIAIINGQKRECFIDTGTTTTHIPGDLETSEDKIEAAILQSRGAPVHGLNPRLKTISIIHSIKLGNYLVKNIPVISYPTLPNDPAYLKEPILGSDLFRNVSITIDPLSHLFIIANQTSSYSPKNFHKWDTVLKFQPYHDKYSDSKIVMILGNINKKPAKFIIDTGQFLDIICIVDPTCVSTYRYRPGLQLLNNIKWSIGGTDYYTSGYQYPIVNTPFQAEIGSPFIIRMKNRICIDYASDLLYIYNYHRAKKDYSLSTRKSYLSNRITNQQKLKNRTGIYYKWVKLLWHNHSIYQICGRPLPVNITLPSWFHPVGNKALFIYDQKGGMNRDSTAFSSFHMFLWLPVNLSKKIQTWLNHFPNNFFISPNKYKVKNGSSIYSSGTLQNQWPTVLPINDKSWYYWVDTKSSQNDELHFSAGLTKIPYGVNDPNFRSNYRTDMGLAIIAPQSPLLPGKPYIEFNIAYRRR